jgi:hypothetical protein
MSPGVGHNQVGHVLGVQNVPERSDGRCAWRVPVALPESRNAGVEFPESRCRRFLATFIDGGNQFLNGNPILISQSDGGNMPGTCGCVTLELKRKFHRRFRDQPIAALADDSSDVDCLRDKCGRAQFCDLFADFVVGNPCSAAATGRNDCSDQDQLESTIHQGFESSTL